MKLTFRSKAQREAGKKKRQLDAKTARKSRAEQARAKVLARLRASQEIVKEERKAESAESSSGADAASSNKRQRHKGGAGEGDKKRQRNFKFKWDDTEDTTAEYDELYDEDEKNSKNVLQFLRRSANSGVSGTEIKASVHWTKKKLLDMVARDWRALREEFEIFVRGRNIPNPLRGWADISLPDSLQKGIDGARYSFPTPIQRQCIPLGLENRDMIGIAATGSGKTAAFLIPLLNSILAQPQEKLDMCHECGPLALVLAPTRELVQQINKECDKLSHHMSIKSMFVVGGLSVEKQASTIRGGVNIIVATPGRLLDLIESQFLVLQQCYYLVLDEADTMIDMGFEEAVISILESMVAPGSKTTHMFSATMAPAIERLAKTYLNEPAMVRIGENDALNENIKQELVIVPSETNKPRVLNMLLKKVRGPTIVFVNTKSAIEGVYEQIKSFETRVTLLHGGRNQHQRERALKDFRDGRSTILVATDVAGRGLDIPNVRHVINYDMATEIERYTHRIGRTGRAGKDGLATTILSKATDGKIVPLLKKQFQKTRNRWKFEWDREFGLMP
jgi:ATP-dependent RNA helicase DDX23/PRP28